MYRICELEEESIEHLLFRCNWTSPICFGFTFQWTNMTSRVVQAYMWTQQIIANFKFLELNYRIELARFYGLCWKIWKACNALVFNQESINPSLVIQMATIFWSEFNNSVQHLLIKLSFGSHLLLIGLSAT